MFILEASYYPTLTNLMLIINFGPFCTRVAIGIFHLLSLLKQPFVQKKGWIASSISVGLYQKHKSI